MLTGPCAERFPQGLSYSPARSHGASIADKHPRPREADPLALGHTPGVSMGGFECILSSNRTHGPCTTLQIGTRGSQGRPGGCQGTVETAEGSRCVYLDSHHTLLQLPAPGTVPDLCLLWMMDLSTLVSVP